MDAIIRFLQDTGFYLFSQDGNWRYLIMLGIACVLLYLGIVKKFEPLLLVPIAFGMLITNLPGANMFHEIFFAGGHIHWDLIGGQPVTASLSKTVYAAAPVLEALERREGATVVVDESALLELVGNSKALNIVLLTVAISQRDAQGNPLLGISLDEFKEAIRVCVKPKFVDMNLAAVDAVCKELGLR